ncbi:hypothetical protein [Streptomyces chiangmaiensis]|uniref:DUF302 domain-containing protein n=1 Tax=Streptomyces chiangmaiensis TaxID=766497 RepID=A0ABU7FXK4_9ACTN|nr:hypothetical protein [Streptomyces chiangmaiensis]MED7828652.1 hypothetical protein [Streptomyces chiangmaiensis]
MPTTTIEHTMRRLDIATGQRFDDFIAAFVDAVPDFDVARMRRVAEQNGTWDDVLRAVAENAPNEFVLFGAIDTRPLMSVAGNKRPAIEYLMGNHTIAERMYRHHPDTLLYAPLRVLIYGSDEGEAVFAIDQPSTVFAGLGVPEVTAVGHELDQKLVALLELLRVEVPSSLRA